MKGKNSLSGNTGSLSGCGTVVAESMAVKIVIGKVVIAVSIAKLSHVGL